MSNQSHCRSWGIIIAVVSISVFSGDTAKTAIPNSPNPEQSRVVLIAKGNSYLENAVTGIISDSLSRRLIKVRTSDLKSLKNAIPSTYNVVVIFNAVAASKLVTPVRNFIERSGDPGKNPTSNVLICTVYGNRWDPENAPVDGVAGATQTLNIKAVANKVLNLIYTSLNINTNPGGVNFPDDFIDR